jgi:hypothetical protein
MAAPKKTKYKQPSKSSSKKIHIMDTAPNASIEVARVNSGSAAPQQRLPDIAMEGYSSLIATAIAGKLDLEYVRELMRMQREWEDRQAEKAFFLAFSRFQGDCPALYKHHEAGFNHKDGEGRTEYKHEKLGDVLAIVKKPLADNGLSLFWRMREEGDNIVVTCVVRHIDGYEKADATLSGPPDKSGGKDIIKAKSSTNSYLQRITAKASLGLAALEDDDDGAGSAHFAEAEYTPDKPPATDKEYASIMAAIEKGTMTLERAMEFHSFSEERIETLRILEENSKANDAGGR